MFVRYDLTRNARVAEQRRVLWIVVVACVGCRLWLGLVLYIEFWFRVVIPVPHDFPGSAGCLRDASSETYLFNCLYDRFLFDGLVIILESSVFGRLPKWSSNRLILVVVFGMSLMDSIILATIVARSEVDHKGSCSMTAILLFELIFLPFRLLYDLPRELGLV